MNTPQIMDNCPNCHESYRKTARFCFLPVFRCRCKGAAGIYWGDPAPRKMAKLSKGELLRCLILIGVITIFQGAFMLYVGDLNGDGSLSGWRETIAFLVAFITIPLVVMYINQKVRAKEIYARIVDSGKPKNQ